MPQNLLFFFLGGGSFTIGIVESAPKPCSIHAAFRGLGRRVWGQGPGFRLAGSGFGVQGVRQRLRALTCKVWGMAFQQWGGDYGEHKL